MDDLDSAPLRAGDPQTVGPFTLRSRYALESSGDVFWAADDNGTVLLRLIERHLIPTREAMSIAEERIRRLRGLEESGIAGVRAHAWEDSSPWIAVAAEPGNSLGSLVKSQGRLNARDVTTLALSLARDLDALHRVNLVHGSLRSSSVLIRPGQLMLADAGLYAPVRDLTGTDSGSAVTDVAWMTPEQLLGGSVTSATDVYLWALVVLLGASGANPFAAGDARTALTRIRSEVPAVGHVLSEPLAGIVTSALAKEAVARPTMADVVERLGGQRVVIAAEYMPAEPVGAPDHLLATLPPPQVPTPSTAAEAGPSSPDEAEPPAPATTDPVESATRTEERSTARLATRWVLVATIAAIVIGIAVGAGVGRLLLAVGLPLEILGSASSPIPEVVWSSPFDEGD